LSAIYSKDLVRDLNADLGYQKRWAKLVSAKKNAVHASKEVLRGILVSILMFSITGIAQSEVPVELAVAAEQQTLSPVILNGRRLNRKDTRPSAPIHTLDIEALTKSLPRTLPESLESLPGVHIQKTASGHGSPYIRGFTGNRTLAVIDGIRYNNATYRDGPNEYFSHIDTFTLSNVELLSGPASAIYGSEAVGGTLSLETRKSDYTAAAVGDWFAHGRQVLRYSTGDSSLISRTAIDFGRGEIWGLRLGLSAKEFGDVRAADLGRLPNTGYDELAWDARLDAKIGQDWALTIAHQGLQQSDVPRTHSTVFSRSFAGTTIGTDLRRDKDQDRSLTYLKIAGPLGLQFAEFGELTLSYQPRQETERRIRGDGLDIDQAFSSNLFAFNSKFEREFSRAFLTYGLDLSHETVDSRRTDLDPSTSLTTERLQGPVGDDANYQQAGLFADLSWDVTDRLVLDLGGRLSYVRADIGRFEDPISGNPISFEDDWSNFSGSARASYFWGAHDQSSLFISAGQAFRAPNIADISRFGRSRSNEFEVASFGLRPENFLSSEIGYRYALDNLTLTAAYYYTDLRNYIETVPTGRIVDGLFEVSKQNAASGQIQGIEVTGAIDLRAGFALSGNATWTRGDLTRATAEGGNLTEPISRIQPLTGNLAIRWTGSELGNLAGPLANTWMSADARFVDSADRLSTADLTDTQRIPIGGTPGYTLINFMFGWNLHQNFTVTISANNLLNEAYRAHGSGSNEPGRHVVLGIDASF